ncbi:uncharacterized protein N7477_001678 [Penicillium maclennaniae]|uniref:uncharacterized protein n=1 Tax=Penicillium maclennaniae TaxID=1343394 RepID=UPI00254211C7|nr:uncharacterized protein N7477_001678 [Penicillium maclennaniae]KAJ5681738.1 hypothetical protein N7477_001678 [Penicillium maclennaniae]
MDTQAQIRRSAAVKHLYQKFGVSKPWFFSPGDLQGLGIQTLQIDVTGDGTLEFDPCFFRPHPERVLQKYPPDPFQMAAIYPPQTLASLTNRPEVTSMIQMEEETGVKNEAARATYNSLEKLLGPDEWQDHARETQYYMECHLDYARMGLPNGSSLRNLGSLHGFRTKPASGDPPTVEFSPLWSFADEQKAPVELFIRYRISQLVEVPRWEKPNPAIDSLVDPVASMQLK